MIAELHNKISSSGSNLSDRLEDQLTGDFFGTIRYLPFELGLKLVLAAAQFQDEHTQQQWLTVLNSISGYMPIRFWPRHAEGEIDLILDLPEALIGIEVKYLSALSSDDDESEEPPTPE